MLIAFSYITIASFPGIFLCRLRLTLLHVCPLFAVPVYDPDSQFSMSSLSRLEAAGIEV